MPTCLSSLTLLPPVLSRSSLFSPFLHPPIPLLLFLRLSLSPPPDAPPPADAIRSALFPPSSILAQSRVPSRFNPRDRPPPPPSLPPLLTSLFTLSLAGIFSLLPHPPSFVSSSSLYQLPSSQPSLVSSLFRGYPNGVISALFFAVGFGFLNAGVTSHSTSTISRRLVER